VGAFVFTSGSCVVALATQDGEELGPGLEEAAQFTRRFEAASLVYWVTLVKRLNHSGEQLVGPVLVLRRDAQRANVTEPEAMLWICPYDASESTG
jgi:predicted ABC-type transport system involved in lysophospholipase L1 biosynthesis ATPase subunit